MMFRRWLAGVVACVALLSAATIAQQPPAAATAATVVYITKTGEKYHTATCRYLAQSKIAKPFAELAPKYDACKVCKPPARPAAALGLTAEAVSTPPAAPARPSSQPKSVRCAATTKKGAQCSRNASAGRSFCWQHGG